MRTPIRTLDRALHYIEDRERAQANLDALTTARLCQLVVQVAHGLSGSTESTPRVVAKDFLPFPDWDPSAETNDGPDRPTRALLTELGKRRALPLHVLTAMLTPPERGP